MKKRRESERRFRVWVFALLLIIVYRCSLWRERKDRVERESGIVDVFGDLGFGFAFARLVTQIVYQ